MTEKAEAEHDLTNNLIFFRIMIIDNDLLW